MTNRSIPKIIQKVGFDFDWSTEKVWALDEPVIAMDIQALTWHFDIPFLRDTGSRSTLKPCEVLKYPKRHIFEYQRVLEADIRYPIDVMENKGQWLILDGLHRLMKLWIAGNKIVQVRIIPRSRIPEIVE